MSFVVGKKDPLVLFELEAKRIKMKKRVLLFLFAIATVLSFTSCATIIGGARYYAKVQVPGHPDAIITVDGQYQGQGEANFLVKRRDADKLTITVEEGNCEPETTRFTKKAFRGWACAGTVLGWTFYLKQDPYVILPIGLVVDACTGALWKPDINEKGVSKIDYDHFLYTINYRAIPKMDQVVAPAETPKDTAVTEKSKADKLRELKQLLDDGILTQEEYDKEKAKILESD